MKTIFLITARRFRDKQAVLLAAIILLALVVCGFVAMPLYGHSGGGGGGHSGGGYGGGHSGGGHAAGHFAGGHVGGVHVSGGGPVAGVSHFGGAHVGSPFAVVGHVNSIHFGGGHEGAVLAHNSALGHSVVHVSSAWSVASFGHDAHHFDFAHHDFHHDGLFHHDDHHVFPFHHGGHFFFGGFYPWYYPYYDSPAYYYSPAYPYTAPVSTNAPPSTDGYPVQPQGAGPGQFESRAEAQRVPDGTVIPRPVLPSQEAPEALPGKKTGEPREEAPQTDSPPHEHHMPQLGQATSPEGGEKP